GPFRHTGEARKATMRAAAAGAAGSDVRKAGHLAMPVSSRRGGCHAGAGVRGTRQMPSEKAGQAPPARTGPATPPPGYEVVSLPPGAAQGLVPGEPPCEPGLRGREDFLNAAGESSRDSHSTATVSCSPAFRTMPVEAAHRHHGRLRHR